MMNKKKNAWLMIILLVVIAVPCAFAEVGSRRGMAEKRLERLIKNIGLSSAQAGVVLERAKRYEEKTREIASKNKAIFGEIEKEMFNDSPDSRKIHNYVLEINKNRAQIQFNRIEQLIELRKDLTPDQKTNFDKLMRQKKERIKKHPVKMGQKKGKI